MALRITVPADAPILTIQQLPLFALYVEVRGIQHEKGVQRFRYTVACYPSAEARAAGAEALSLLDTSPLFGYVEASAAAVSVKGCYPLAYEHLYAELTALWPSATISNA